MKNSHANVQKEMQPTGQKVEGTLNTWATLRDKWDECDHIVNNQVCARVSICIYIYC